MGKKLMVLLLALVMCVSVAGCKKEADSNNVTGDVYMPTFTEYSADFQWVENVVSNGNTITLIGSKYDYDTYVSQFVAMSIDTVTGENVTKVLDLGEGVSISNICAYKDGYIAVGETNENIGGPITTYETETVAEVVTGVATDDMPVPNEDYSYEGPSYHLSVLDKDFNEIAKIALDEISDKASEEEGWFYISSICADKDNNIYVKTDMNVYIIDEEGHFKNMVKFDNWINNMYTTGNGTVLIAYYDDEYNSLLAKFDSATLTMGDKLENIPIRDINRCFPAGGSKLYINSESCLYLYDVDTQTSEEVLNWINCDINTNNLNGFAALENGDFVAVCTTYDYSSDEAKMTIELANIKKVPASSVKDKKVLTMAMMYLNYDIQERIIKFNRTNEKYRINVKTYVNDDYSNYEDAQTLFNSDLASGNMADLILLSDMGSTGVANLAAKGLLADLAEIIDKDPDINMEDFIPSVIEALKINGKLYNIGASFNVQTLAGKVADVGTGKSWTFQEMMALADKHPDAQLFNYATKQGIFQMMLIYSMDTFYDNETGKCMFDSEEFKNLLEASNRFPTEISYDEDEYVSLPTQLRSGKVLLTEIYLSEFEEIQLYEKLYGEPINFIGFPTNGTSGAVANVYDSMCISAKSKNKEGAFEFIKQFLMPEYQENNINWNLPINKAAFEKRIEKAMELNEDNEYTWMYDDVEVKIGALSEEQAQTIRDIVYGISSTAGYDEKLFNIVTEEAAAFFEGQKSAAEVAGIIQSRAQIYMDESR